MIGTAFKFLKTAFDWKAKIGKRVKQMHKETDYWDEGVGLENSTFTDHFCWF